METKKIKLNLKNYDNALKINPRNALLWPNIKKLFKV